MTHREARIMGLLSIAEGFMLILRGNRFTCSWTLGYALKTAKRRAAAR